jgi:hypothetical protein
MRRCRHRLAIVALTFVVCQVICTALLCARAASAQETINQASVSGRVADAQGGVVPGALVAARHTETNSTAETVPDAEGRFRFPYLKVGSYELSVRLQGFRDITRPLTLTVGSAFEVPIVLEVAGVEASVTVTAAATVLEAARSQIAGTVSQPEIQNLPLNGRNFLDLALLVPGVSPPNVTATQLFAETSAVPGVGLSVGSQRNFSNNFIVDGLSANDDAAGLSGIPYGVDAVEQFQVVTSGGQAELGRALGGYVNVVTKSGTNLARGDIYHYLRDDRLNAANPLFGQTLPMDQKQYGGSVGGPIRRDRTFYFSNIEQRRLNQTGLVTISPASLSAINARLAAVGYPGAPIATGIYANPVRSSNVLAKIDHQLNGRDQVSVRYSLYHVTSSNSRGAGALNAPSASAGLANTDQTVAFSNMISVSDRTVNETRAQFAYSDLKAPPTDAIGPAVSITGVASFGTLSTSPTARVNKLYQVVNNLSRSCAAARAGQRAAVGRHTANLDNLRQSNVSLSPGQAGAPVFPSILPGVVPSVTLLNLTTMDRRMQNAYSRQASAELEQQIGTHATASIGYQYVRGLHLIMSVNQNVPACVAAGTNNGCRPNPSYANNNQYSPVADSNYHGLHVSFVQRPAKWGSYRVSYTYSKSMNNVGENFFSSPIDPTDISKDWGRSDDDQRHRLVVHGAVHSPMAPARTAWRRLAHGFQASVMLQAYSSLPLNIISGVTTIQQTPGRPIVNGAFIERNAGNGADYFSLNARISRSFRLASSVRLEGSVEAFNVTNRTNITGLNATFGPGAYPSSPSSTFGQATAVGEPRSVQLAVRLRFRRTRWNAKAAKTAKDQIQG